MSDENFLSQDDIDALMGGIGGDDNRDGGSGGGDNGGSGGGGGINPEEIQPALEMILRQASTVISTVLNKNADLNIKQLLQADNTNVWGEGEKFKSDALLLRTGFIAGLSGELYMVYTKKETALLADLMMMGDGSADYEDDHKDALGELGNQIMGAVSTAMGTDFGLSISCDQVEILEYGEAGGVSFTPAECILASITMKIEDFEDSEILIVIDGNLSKGFVDNAGAGDVPSELDLSDSVSEADSIGSISDESMDDMDLGEPSTSVAPSYTSSGNPNVDMLLDIPLDVTIELGRSDLSIRKILELGPGSIVELNRKASEPVDLLVNDKVVAKGEVVVVDEYFGIRIVSLVTPEERIKLLR